MPKCSGAMYCPCCRCKNIKLKNKEEIRSHLTNCGFYEEYKHWSYHGEGRIEDEVPDVHVGTSHGFRTEDIENLQTNIGPDHPEYDINNDGEDDTTDDVQDATEIEDVDGPEGFEDAHVSEDLDRIMKLLEDSEKDLYEGCTEYSGFSCVLELLHIKSLSGMANTSFVLHLKYLACYIEDGNYLSGMVHQALNNKHHVTENWEQRNTIVLRVTLEHGTMFST
ncbi:uncharacterized protein LOC109831683 [Asparagus officinalis]|uniref:uncharacterized protein LOC109831683 n=1 Tax=Asparagus officinalis TaxID=4686 RepID=UPI00098E3AAC|nr:uncharacterized protein LOC109831683 [Asparagus officinalis]